MSSDERTGLKFVSQQYYIVLHVTQMCVCACVYDIYRAYASLDLDLTPVAHATTAV
jgi:hypothetical protein